MKFKVTGVTTSQIKVEYADGTWANVPISKGQTALDIKRVCENFHYTEIPFDSTSDVPLQVSDTELEFVHNTDTVYSYQEARAASYPTIGDQLDALHWAREGDDTALKAIDTSIKNVKSKVAKDKTYTPTTLAAALS